MHTPLYFGMAREYVGDTRNSKIGLSDGYKPGGISAKEQLANRPFLANESRQRQVSKE